MDRQAPLPAALRETRERTIDALSRHYADDRLELPEFERRLDLALRATEIAELQPLLADLPALADAPKGQQPAQQTPLRSTLGVAMEGRIAENGFVVGIMGGAERKGRWVPPRHLYVCALMGGVGLDFREAILGPGETEVTIFAMMGGAEIIVPPGLRVESGGIAIMGAFEHDEDATLSADPRTPTLRINGAVLMGGVEVTVRRPGETAGDARRRRKEERQRRRLEGR